jgi:16S rRNA processing protein RimM
LNEPLVILAAVAGAHGIGGEVRLKLFAEGIDSLKHHGRFDVGGQTLTLKSVRPATGGAVARFAEIGDRNAAEALRGATLAVPRSALPPLGPGEYYHVDLIGRACVDQAGAPLGEVVAVENFGAGDLIEVERADRTRFLVPLARAVAEDGERLVIDPAFIA